MKNRMVPFLNSPLVKLQSKLCILQQAAGERSLFCHLARGQSKEQARRAFERAEIIFSSTYESFFSSLLDPLQAPSTQGSREGTRSSRNSRGITEASTCPHL